MQLGPGEAGTVGLLVCKWLRPESCVAKNMSFVLFGNLADFWDSLGSGLYSTKVFVSVLANSTGHNTNGCPGGAGQGDYFLDHSGQPKATS